MWIPFCCILQYLSKWTLESNKWYQADCGNRWIQIWDYSVIFFGGLLYSAFSITDLVSMRAQFIHSIIPLFIYYFYNELENIWNEVAMAKMRYHLGICLNRLQKMMKNLSQDNQWSRQDLNQIPPPQIQAFWCYHYTNLFNSITLQMD